MKTTSAQVCFGGVLSYNRHFSSVLDCEMRFSVFVPPSSHTGPRPLLWFLSGLTCTEDNFTVKAGAYRLAAELGLVVVAPDTSPRGEGVADDEAYDLGQGAGFYVNARRQPWAPHFQMYSYITSELPGVVANNFPVDMGAQGITGHSMGGHGALTIGLKNPDTYRSVSAFSPIVNPVNCPWGHKAFTAYLGEDRELWKAHDACELVKAAGDRSAYPEILIDQGDKDGFLEEQLLPQNFADACADAKQKLRLRMQPGYDHSYFFISSFIEDHLRHHAAILG